MRSSLAIASLLAIAVSVPAAATTINFDDGKAGAAVGGFYTSRGVTFSDTVFSTNYGLNGTSGALAIVSDTSLQTVFGGDTPIVGAFTRAQTSIGLRGIDVGAAGLRLEAYGPDNALLGFDQFFGTAKGIGTFRDLAVSASGITSFRVFQPGSTGGNNTMGDGIVVENLSFSPGVPEPATWAMMVSGFGLLGMALRRKQAAVRFA
jgi:hypothetical protein